jgi:hypothetical protein
MMKAWASFAKDPSGGLKAMKWPTYEADSEFQYLRLE